MKKIIVFLILITTLSLTVSANHLLDNENLLSALEQTEVEASLKEASDASGYYVKAVTVESFGGKAIDTFTEEQCDKSNTVLLLISLTQGEFCLTASDTASSVYTNSVLALIEADVKPYLSGRDFASAITRFSELCVEYADYTESYYSDSLPMSRIFVPIVIGFAIGLITVCIMKSKLKSVRYKSSAADYVRSGSLNITSSYDRFLWRSVSRVKRQSNSSSSGSSHSGGSRSFSSRSGKF